MANQFFVAPSPHVHSAESTTKIMRDVVIALLPALVVSALLFGWSVLGVTALSVVCCVVFEYLIQRFMLRGAPTVGNLSAVVTGVLLAFVCPVTIPYWTIILGDFFAIVLVKMLFGGLGKNIVNPALAGRAFLFSWPVLMSNWVKVGFDNAAGLLSTADAVTAAPPMSAMHQGALPEESILDMFLGNIGGCIGETSALLLIIGFIYLLYRKVITARIPLAYIGTVAILAFLFPQGNDRIAWMAAQVFGGGLMLGAIFMATDYVTSPLTKLGQIVYGIGCGVITILIRYFGGYSEGVTYAILCMNACAVLLDKIGRPVKFGAPKKEAAKK